MSNQTETLGGRLPLLDPQMLSAEQKGLYDRMNQTAVPWADSAHFQSKTKDGRLIGPFNPVLFSPRLTSAFLELQAIEEKHTSLSDQVRQVLILSVGAVWKSEYELYAHSAVARKAGLSEESIRSLVSGGLPNDLSDQEKIAQRFALQLSTEHCVDDALYREAERTFGQQGLVDAITLIGIYHSVCALLNAFEIPAPQAQV
ncbi:carboxymuconolactone decarboxylase family protein [Nostoc sp.]|uniref:carboxymuconolactone decarboxylase family protein n=1 Tax=Nostoc sp. TaxID=1180 RepID=UPI002FFAF5F5